MTQLTQLDSVHLDFALGLQRAIEADLDPDATTGLVWSPYSVASALGVAAAGAREATYAELAAALAPGGDLTGQGRLLAASAKPEGAEAAVANGLWLRTGLEIVDTYRETVLDWPGGGIHTADFAGAPESARQAINADVAGTTRGLIEELLSPGDVHPAIAAVIVNALYLKVAWKAPFAESDTGDAPFHAPSGTRAVPTMRQTERMPYAAADGWRMVTLSTAGELAVDVLLPDPPDSPDGTPPPEPGPDGDPGPGSGPGSGPEAGRGAALPTGDLLSRLHEAAAPTKIALAMPRFRIESRALLRESLGRLGVVRAFSRGADFSGITAAERVWIDQVVHQAVLDVDEQGFEGAAATALMMRTVSFDVGRPVEFRVDRPFLVVVRHARTGAVFFSARVTEPA